MKLNIFSLSAAAMVNAASGAYINGVNLGGYATTYTGDDNGDPIGDIVLDYAILAKTAISTVPFSPITGDIAVSATSASITGFSLIGGGITSTSSTSLQVTGNVYASDYKEGGTPATLISAVSDMEAAHNHVAGMVATKPVVNSDLNIGGTKLTSGVYTINGDVSISGGDLTFDGGGDPNAIFVIQTSKSVLQKINTEVILIGEAKAENIYWSVAGAVTVEAGAKMAGILWVKTAVTFITGASMNGRIFAQTAVVLQKATITMP
jgi:hypothetical protein